MFITLDNKNQLQKWHFNIVETNWKPFEQIDFKLVDKPNFKQKMKMQFEGLARYWFASLCFA